MNIIRLNKIEEKYNLKNNVYAVLGLDNITGSIKDITVYQMLLHFKSDGLLKEGTTIVEATSGNTGIALSYYQKEFNYQCIIVMPSSMSEERRKMITKFDAKLVLIDGGMEECHKYADELIKKNDNMILFDQFNNKYNVEAHYEITGPLIYNNIKDIDYIFAGIGTGGTICGTTKYLKEKNNHVKAIGIEPYESPLLTKGYSNNHLIQGIGANFIPEICKNRILDGIICIKGDEKFAIDETGKYIPITTEECPELFPIYLEESKQCIKDCRDYTFCQFCKLCSY